MTRINNSDELKRVYRSDKPCGKIMNHSNVTALFQKWKYKVTCTRTRSYWRKTAMQIKPISNDEQWFYYLRRACKTDESVLAFMRLMMGTYPFGNWIHSVSCKGRKNKKVRLLVMCWDYYDSLTPKRRYECFNRHFETTWSSDHRFFLGYERPTVFGNDYSQGDGDDD